MSDDNLLCRVADPLLIVFTIYNKLEYCQKVFPRLPDEPVGVAGTIKYVATDENFDQVQAERADRDEEHAIVCEINEVSAELRRDWIGARR